MCLECYATRFRNLAPGVFQMLPVKGTVVWNSHAFNLTDEVATNQQYQNLYFAPPAQRVFYGRGIFDSQQRTAGVQSHRRACGKHSE